MIRTFLMCFAFLALAGCARSSDIPLADGPLVKNQTTIIDGFGTADTAIVGSPGYRVGGYYNFEPFDSITISFSAKRFVTWSAVDHFMIKVGPGYYVSDSLSSTQKSFSISVRPLDLAKPQYAALTFIVQETQTSFVLSQLRVVGWSGD